MAYETASSQADQDPDVLVFVGFYQEWVLADPEKQAQTWRGLEHAWLGLTDEQLLQTYDLLSGMDPAIQQQLEQRRLDEIAFAELLAEELEEAARLARAAAEDSYWRHKLRRSDAA